MLVTKKCKNDYKLNQRHGLKRMNNGQIISQKMAILLQTPGSTWGKKPYLKIKTKAYFLITEFKPGYYSIFSY